MATTSNAKFTRAEYNVARVINEAGMAGCTVQDFGATSGRGTVNHAPLVTMLARGMVEYRAPFRGAGRKAYFLTQAGIAAFAASVEAAATDRL